MDKNFSLPTQLGEIFLRLSCLGGSEKERKGGRNAALVSPCDVCLSPGSRPPGCSQSNRTTTRNGRRGCLHACPFDFLDGKSLAFAK